MTTQDIDVSIGIDKKYIATPEDPFNVSALEVKGISQNTRRRAKYTEKRLEGTAGVQSKQIDTDYTAYDLLEVATPPYDLGYLSKLYDISPFNYAAINAKVANVVGLGYEFVESFATKQLLEKTKSENKKRLIRQRLEEAKYLLGEKLDSLNEEALFIESISRAYTDYQATGNGYIEIGRTTKGTIGYVGSIPSSTMRVRKRRDGYVQLVAEKAVFFRNFGDTKTTDPIGNQSQPNEIIHLKNYSPVNTFYGVPDIVAALPAAAGNEFAMRYNLDYFEHRAAPRYIIIVKGAKLSEISEQRLMEFFQAGLKGKNHRSVYIPLPGDDVNNKVTFEMKPVENGVQDSSFDNYRKSNRDEILMAHRTPITKIGIADGASIALAKDADKTFKEQVTRPEQKVLEKKVNKIINEFTDALVLKFNELTLTDEDTQSQIDERYIRVQALTPNEIRIRQGLPPLDGGDSIVDLSAGQKAEAKIQTNGNRTRDQERTANAADNGQDGSRAAAGEGRQQA